MGLSLVSRGDYDIFTCTGDLKVNLLPHISPQLSRYIQTHPDRNLVLDLSAVDFMDSSTIRMFLNLHKRLSPSGLRLCLLTPSAAVFKILEDVKLTSVFSIYADAQEIDREMSDALLRAYRPFTRSENGLQRLACDCPVCGSSDIHGYLINETDFVWSWESDDPFPVSFSRESNAPIDMFGLLPIVCTDCFMCSIQVSHFGVPGASTTSPRSTLLKEVAHQLSQTVKARKKMVESCMAEEIGFFDHPRQKITVYCLLLLAEYCTRACATAKQVPAPFLMGYIHYLAAKYAPGEKKAAHIDTTRTWLSQVLADRIHYRYADVAKAYFILFMVAQTRGSHKDAKRLFEEFTLFVKTSSALGETQHLDTAHPLFWYGQAQRINGGNPSPIIPA